MRDSDIFKILIPLIRSNLALFDLPADTVVRQSNQPATRGILSGPAIFLHKISDRKYGYPERKHIWNEESNELEYHEKHYQESTFQVDAMAHQNSDFSASDIINSVSRLFQHNVIFEALKNTSLGIYRITDIRSLWFSNDKDQFENKPSFDFTLIHDKTIVSTQPFADVEYEIHQI